MSKFGQIALLVCAGLSAGTVASAQMRTHEAIEAGACLQSGEDSCLLDLMFDYAAEGEIEARFLFNMLDDQTVMLMLLRRCRPLSETALRNVQDFMAANELNRSPIAMEELAERAEFERALNEWLADPRIPWEPTGQSMGIGLDLETSLDTRTATAFANLAQIVLVEGFCGDHDRARYAVAELDREIDRVRDSVTTYERIMMLRVRMSFQQGFGGNEDVAQLTEEIADLIPQLEEPSFGTTIAVLEIVRDYDLDMNSIAARWNNPMFSAIAAHAALGRRNPGTELQR